MYVYTARKLIESCARRRAKEKQNEAGATLPNRLIIYYPCSCREALSRVPAPKSGLTPHGARIGISLCLVQAPPLTPIYIIKNTETNSAQSIGADRSAPLTPLYLVFSQFLLHSEISRKFDDTWL
jgi:hypothetical protein